MEAGGKLTVVGAVVQAESRKVAGVLGIVDDDYDSLLGLANPSVNLIRTEARDIETLMLSSPAFDRVLTELGDPGKIHTLEQREGRSVSDAFVSRALIFGQLRYLNAVNGWTIAFNRLSPYRFADEASWSFDRAAILGEVANQVPGMTAAIVETRLAQLSPAAPWSILHGKDSVCVLAIGLRGAIGNQPHSIDQITRMLRLAFDNAMFGATILYTAVKAWETANAPYRVLSV